MDWKDKYKKDEPKSEESTFLVDDIFESIQFEGSRCGTYSLFIRFFGCNLKCPFCDTPQDSQSPVLPLSELVKVIEGRKQKNIILTGGEPTLQPIDELILAAPEFNYAIETNGTQTEKIFYLKEEIKNVWVTFSPKQINDWQKRYLDIWNLVDEIKIIYGSVSNELLKIAMSASETYETPIYIQPMYTEQGAQWEEVYKFVAANPSCKFSYQTQKVLGIK